MISVSVPVQVPGIVVVLDVRTHERRYRSVLNFDAQPACLFAVICVGILAYRGRAAHVFRL